VRTCVRIWRATDRLQPPQAGHRGRQPGHHRSHRSRTAHECVASPQLSLILHFKPRWGYRRAHARLGQLGWTVNRKRVQRLWREEGLRVPTRRRKRRRLGDSIVPADRLRAERQGHVWAIDYMFDQTADGRVLKLFNVVDEYTREALAMHVARRINADQTVAVLDGLAHRRGAPAHIRCDNEPELTAHALKAWCRFTTTATAFIDPGAPWQNPYVESFNARVRDEVLDIEQFSCLTEATVVISDWRQDYNTRRPHSALAMQTPDAFARATRVRTEEPAEKSGIPF
jgi:putative transposase